MKSKGKTKSKKLERRVALLEKKIEFLSDQFSLALMNVSRDPAGSAWKCGAVLERHLREFFLRMFGREPKNPELGHILKNNQFTRKFDRTMVSRMNSVRDMRNIAVHEPEKVKPEDARRALEDLCDILEWFQSKAAILMPSKPDERRESREPAGREAAEATSDAGAGGPEKSAGLQEEAKSQEDPAKPKAKSVREKESSRRRPAPKKLRVLAVDDDDDVLRQIKHGLMLAGHKVVTAHDGSEALLLLEKITPPPGLFILDIKMEPMDGLVLLKRLRAKPRFKKTPVIMLTANPDPAYKESLSRLGANVFLTKPFEAEELQTCIRGLGL